MADGGDTDRHRSHSFRLPPVSSGIIHPFACPPGSARKRKYASDATVVFHAHSTTYSTDFCMRFYPLPTAAAFPVFVNRTVTAGSRCPIRVLL